MSSKRSSRGRRKADRAAAEPAPASRESAREPAPVMRSHPPRQNRALLAMAAAGVLAWLLFLGYLAVTS